MSRSNYSDDLEQQDLAMWRGRVASAIRGKRGQKLLIELRDALDAMPVKRLIDEELKDSDGEVCALGAVGVARGVDMSRIDPEDYDQVAAAFDIAPCLAQEIAYENDEAWGILTPEKRWEHMRKWVDKKIKQPAQPSPPE